MKGYKLYKNVNPVYFNLDELLANIILPLVISSYISWVRKAQFYSMYFLL